MYENQFNMDQRAMGRGRGRGRGSGGAKMSMENAPFLVENTKHLGGK